MSVHNQVKRDIKNDIVEIENAIKEEKINFEELKKIHIKIDGKYQSKIENWGKSMYNWNDNFGFDYNYADIDSLKENLYTMKSKLEGYLQDYDLKLTESLKTNKPLIYNYNNNENANVNSNKIEMKLDFNIIKENIKNMESLTNEETEETLKRIKELEDIYKSNDKRKNKWEKAKKVAIWLLNKSVDVAIQVLPILLEITK